MIAAAVWAAVIALVLALIGFVAWLPLSAYGAVHIDPAYLVLWTATGVTVAAGVAALAVYAGRGLRRLIRRVTS